MPYQTLKRSTKFIDSVKLPKRAPSASRRRGLALTAPAAPVELQEKTAQAVVAGSGLIFSEEGVSKQVKEDLLTCTLFAQFAAQSKVGSSTKVVEWYKAYFEALTHVGWTVQSTDFIAYEATSDQADVHQAVLQIASGVLG